MREIKFRAKSTETKLHTARWRFGDLRTSSNEACKPLIFVHFPKPMHDGNGYWYEVEAETVGQFTGARESRHRPQENRVIGNVYDNPELVEAHA